MTTLDQRQFDALSTWLQEPQQCHARPTKNGWHYRCNHTFQHTETWLRRRGLEVESHLAQLRGLGITCDCGILSTLIDWPTT
ncbi:hypothetical protein KSD_49930 [Ktedonobacter sp. SOSP1-85]|uniref:DUF2695 domain-containing protein n=1 Tax=Ktedonobacter sp. SOSP1-85 TaxID=2778367 RepID=UPI001A307302|nr:DUF2695 domain-containing protein [Ktedonobacter sp. SOSP1-85]GHO77222.1 hypothetical protein KSD_49930 [Ktedonobacter sp. SOSP1-85]